jgi:hypothetical protein
MDLEERLVLPLVERHIFAAEWEAMEQHAITSMTAEDATLTVGMVMYEADRQSLTGVFPEEVLEVAPARRSSASPARSPGADGPAWGLARRSGPRPGTGALS